MVYLTHHNSSSDNFWLTWVADAVAMWQPYLCLTWVSNAVAMWQPYLWLTWVADAVEAAADDAGGIWVWSLCNIAYNIITDNQFDLHSVAYFI